MVFDISRRDGPPTGGMPNALPEAKYFESGKSRPNLSIQLMELIFTATTATAFSMKVPATAT